MWIKYYYIIISGLRKERAAAAAAARKEAERADAEHAVSFFLLFSEIGNNELFSKILIFSA